MPEHEDLGEGGARRFAGLEAEDQAAELKERRSIARRVKAMMAFREMTSTELANALGRSQSAVSFRLSAARPWTNGCAIERVAEVLGVAVNYLTDAEFWPDEWDED